MPELKTTVSTANPLAATNKKTAPGLSFRRFFTKTGVSPYDEIEWEKRTAEILPFPLQAQRVGFPAAIRAREEGDIENGHAACGQSAGLISEIVPARELIERMIAEAEAALSHLRSNH